MPDATDHARVIKLEAQMEAVLKFEPRITRLEKALYIGIGALVPAALGGGASLAQLITGG